MAKHKPWVLVDPIHKDPDTSKPILMGPQGRSTTDPLSAQPFGNEEEARKAAEGRPDKWVPRPLDDFLTQRKVRVVISRDRAVNPTIIYVKDLNTVSQTNDVAKGSVDTMFTGLSFQELEHLPDGEQEVVSKILQAAPPPMPEDSIHYIDRKGEDSGA